MNQNRIEVDVDGRGKLLSCFCSAIPGIRGIELIFSNH